MSTQCEIMTSGKQSITHNRYSISLLVTSISICRWQNARCQNKQINQSCVV